MTFYSGKICNGFDIKSIRPALPLHKYRSSINAIALGSMGPITQYLQSIFIPS
jgi:hypothetical protein